MEINHFIYVIEWRKDMEIEQHQQCGMINTSVYNSMKNYSGVFALTDNDFCNT